MTAVAAPEPPVVALRRPAGDVRIATRLASARVVCIGSSPEAGEIGRLLCRAGVGDVLQAGIENVPDADLVVAAPAPEEVALLDGWNEEALESRREWLQLLPWDGRLLAIGPLFVPGRTACFRCYLLRRAASVGLGRLGPELERRPTRARAGVALRRAAAVAAAEHALRRLVSREPRLPGVLYALDEADGIRLTPHRVLAVPACPACSTGARRARRRR